MHQSVPCTLHVHISLGGGWMTWITLPLPQKTGNFGVVNTFRCSLAKMLDQHSVLVCFWPNNGFGFGLWSKIKRWLIYGQTFVQAHIITVRCRQESRQTAIIHTDVTIIKCCIPAANIIGSTSISQCNSQRSWMIGNHTVGHINSIFVFCTNKSGVWSYTSHLSNTHITLLCVRSVQQNATTLGSQQSLAINLNAVLRAVWGMGMTETLQIAREWIRYSGSPMGTETGVGGLPHMDVKEMPK